MIKLAKNIKYISVLDIIGVDDDVMQVLAVTFSVIKRITKT